MRNSDVNRNFPGRIKGENNLAYGAIHPFPLPGWQPSQLVSVRGINWQVIFKPDGADYLEIERGGKIIDRHLEGPNVLISGIDGMSDPVEALSSQKPLIDVIRGLLLLFGPPGKPILLPPVWEGVLRKTSPETIAYEVGRHEAQWPGLTKDHLEAWGKEWEAFDPTAAPPEVAFALRWFYKGMLELYDLSGERADAFTALWLSIITLVRAKHAQNIGGDPSEMQRFIAFAYLRFGEPEMAMEPLEASLAITGDRVYSAYGLYLKGGVHINIGEPQIGADYIQRALALDDTAHWAGDARESLVGVYTLLGNLEAGKSTASGSNPSR